MEGKILRVAAYIRVSSDHDDQEGSYETQRIYFEELLAQNPDWISAGVYADYGISGTSSEGRTGYNRLMRHCRDGKIDRIVTKSISRFSRNTRDFLKAIDILKANNITIVFEKEHLDTAISQNDLMLTAFGAVAQEESRVISANIRWGLEKRRRRGETRNIPIYGYRYAEGEDSVEITPGGYSFRKVVICEEEAKTVRRIFEKIAEGRKYSEIARELNFNHVPAPNAAALRKRRSVAGMQEGKLNPELEEGWTPRHIGQIIRLERYAGDVRMGKTYTPDYKTHRAVINKGEMEQYYVKNHHPAIISRELFEQAQLVLQINALRVRDRKRNTVKYPFSGRLVCGHCGRFYHTRNRDSSPVWQCSSTLYNSGKRVCTAEKIYETQIYRMCRKAVMARFALSSASAGKETGQEMTDILREETTGTSYTRNDKGFTSGNSGLVGKLLDILETIQESDSMEYDRSFLYRQISDAIDETDRAGQILESLRASYEAKQMRRDILHEEITEEQLSDIREHIVQAERKLRESNEYAEQLRRQLDHMERYWTSLETDYEWRKKTIDWMKTLPDGPEGTGEFLDGLNTDYVRALILSIEVDSPVKFRIHWFDDVVTDVEMYYDVEGEE